MLSVAISRKHGPKSFRFDSLVDTGSPYCLFRSDIGPLIGLDVESGVHQDVGGVVAGMHEMGYFHDLNLFVEGNWMVQIRAGFLKNLCVAGLLGRRGFFQNFKVTFDHGDPAPSMEIERISLIQ